MEVVEGKIPLSQKGNKKLRHNITQLEKSLGKLAKISRE